MKRLFLIGIAFVVFLSYCRFTNIREPDIKNPKDIAEVAQEYFKMKEYESAIYYYMLILKHHPDNKKACAFANYEIGFCYYYMEEYDKAKEYFNKVIKDYSDIETAKVLASMLLTKIRKIEAGKEVNP